MNEYKKKKKSSRRKHRTGSAVKSFVNRQG